MPMAKPLWFTAPDNAKEPRASVYANLGFFVSTSSYLKIPKLALLKPYLYFAPWVQLSLKRVALIMWSDTHLEQAFLKLKRACGILIHYFFLRELC